MKYLERRARKAAITRLMAQPALLDADRASTVRNFVLDLALDELLETCILATEASGADVVAIARDSRVVAATFAKIGIVARAQSRMLRALADVVELAASRCSIAVQGRADAEVVVAEARAALAASNVGLQSNAGDDARRQLT